MPSNKQAMIEKYGSELAYKAHLKTIASVGGSRKVSKGRNKNAKTTKEPNQG